MRPKALPKRLLQVSLIIWLPLLSLALILLLPQVAYAGGEVTDCSNDLDLHAKLAGGGLVTFNCGSAPVTITLTTTDLPRSHIHITQTTTISGGGLITLQGNGTARIFDVAGARLTLEGLAITRGRAFAPNNNGGAIYITGGGEVSVTDSRFYDNQAEFGGAIRIDKGVLTVTNSSLFNNEAVQFGGAIYVADLEPTSLPRNRVTIVNSAIISNTARDGDGGAIRVWGSTLTVANSTLSNNRALEVVGEGFTGGDGGAIGVGGSEPSSFSLVAITNTTIYSNSASASGGGVHIDGGGGSGLVKNSIIAENTANVGANCSNINLVSLGHNLTSDASCNFDAGGDMTNTDPLLGPLADNGGGTLTHAPLPGSPAINAADNSACAAPPVSGVDQRGVPRPQGASCDMGAVEATASLALIKTSQDANGGALTPGDTITYTIVVTNSGLADATSSLISDTTPAHTTFVPGSISLTPEGAGTPGTALPILADNLTITASQAVTVAFAVAVNLPLPDGTVITNTASVTSAGTPSLISGSVTDTVTSVPTLTIRKSPQDANGGALIPDDIISYTIVVTNSGTANATGSVISDTLPANTTFVPGSISLTPPGAGTPGVAPPVLASDLTITASQAVTVDFAVIVNKPLDAGTVITNTASVASIEVPVPKTDSVTGTVSTTPAINVAKDGPSNASVDETVVYTFTVTNVGDTLLEDVQVVDDYAGPANYVGGDDGDLKLGLTEAWIYTASYTILPSDPDPLTNTVSVTATDALDTQATDSDEHSTKMSEPILLPIIMKDLRP